MKIALKELKGLVRHMLSEADPKKKEKKPAMETGFTCPRHNLNLMPFFNRRLKVDPSGPSADQLKPFKYIQPASGPNPELSVAKQYSEKAKIKFYFCPLRENPGVYGPPKKRSDNDDHPMGVECDYVIIPKETRSGVESRAYGEVARGAGQVGVPVKRKKVGTDKDAIPQPMLDELERMERMGYRWKRIRGEKGTPDQWKKIKASSPKEYSGDDEHYLSYPYPMALAKANGKTEPAYWFSRDKVARALLHLGWNIIEPATKERHVTPSSMPDPDASVTATMTKKGQDPWYDDDEFDDDDDPWDEDTDPNVSDDDEDVMPDRWK